MLEGISFSLQRSKLPIIIIQSDFSILVVDLIDDSLNKSTHGHLILEMKRLLEQREFIPQKLDRHQNSVAHCLANIGRSGGCTACWLHRVPDSVSSFVLADCNTIIVG